MISVTMDKCQRNHSFVEPTVSKSKRFDLSQNVFLGGTKSIQKF